MKRALLAGIAFLLLIAAAWAPQWLVFLLALALAKGLVVLGLLLLMRTGLVSFGQGLYFGLGAYAAALLAHRGGLADAALMMIAGPVCAAAVAAILGLLLARYREIFFAMLSLAFSMILYGLLVKSSALGQADCDRGCLQETLMRYMEAVVANDPDNAGIIKLAVDGAPSTGQRFDMFPK